MLIALVDHCDGQDSRELDEEHGVDDDPVQGEVLPQLLSWDRTVLDEGGGADKSGKTVDHHRFGFLMERLVWLFQWTRECQTCSIFEAYYEDASRYIGEDQTLPHNADNGVKSQWEHTRKKKFNINFKKIPREFKKKEDKIPRRTLLRLGIFTPPDRE